LIPLFHRHNILVKSFTVFVTDFAEIFWEKNLSLKPIRTYGIQLWGCTKPSNTKIIQRIQSKILRLVFDAPWYVSNKTLHEISGTPFVKDEINRMSASYLHRLQDPPNQYARQIQPPPPPPLRKGYADDGPQMPYLKPRLDTTNY
jgi:hypothetical protein